MGKGKAAHADGAKNKRDGVEQVLFAGRENRGKKKGMALEESQRTYCRGMD